MSGPYQDRLKERLERRSARITETGCQLWLGAIDSSGYGTIQTQPAQGKRVTWSTHRLQWMLHNGTIPEGKIILHSCDIPCCINVSHLSVGTHADNSHDRDRKGRQVAHRGSCNGNSKLKEHHVRAIRLDVRRNSVIAKEHGVSLDLIWKIKAGRMWRHLKG